MASKRNELMVGVGQTCSPMFLCPGAPVENFGQPKGACCDSNRQCSSKYCSMFDTKCWDGTCGLAGCVLPPPDFGIQKTKKSWGVCQ